MINKKWIRRIIISCKTNIGDVVVALPIAGLLKERYPDCKIILLARNYVKDIVDCSDVIDEFLSVDTLLNTDKKTAIDLLTSLNVDIFIHVTPDKKIAYLAKKANIPIRIGTARRWYHFLFCNRIVWASRRSPNKHEAQFNVRMLSPFNIPYHYTGEELIPFIRLHSTAPIPEKILMKINFHKFNLIIHPGTNGHTKEWPITHFQALIASLSKDQFNIFITGTHKELDTFKAALIDPFPHVHNVMGEMTLGELVSFIDTCDGSLVGSTGPVHLSAALGKRTLGLYPVQIGRNVNRWRPLGTQSYTLSAPGICSLCAQNPNVITDNVPGCHCMEALPVEQVKNVLEGWQQNKQKNYLHHLAASLA